VGGSRIAFSSINKLTSRHRERISKERMEFQPPPSPAAATQRSQRDAELEEIRRKQLAKGWKETHGKRRGCAEHITDLFEIMFSAMRS